MARRRCRKLSAEEKRQAWSPPESNAGLGWDRRRPSGLPGDVRGLADRERPVDPDLSIDDLDATDDL